MSGAAWAIIGVIAALVALFVVLGPLQTYLAKKKATSIVGDGLPTPGDGNTADQNLIGPWVVEADGTRDNRSVGCPPSLLPMPPGQAGIGYVDVPQSDIKPPLATLDPNKPDMPYEEPDGHLHYITAHMSGPPGSTRMDVTFDVQADDGAEVRPRTGPDLPASISLFMQVVGDDLSGVGEKVYNRWWTDATVLWQPQTSWQHKGTFTISAPLDIDHWFEEDSENHNPDGSGIPNNPTRRQQFFQKLLAAEEGLLNGFTCGGASGKGHGIFAVKGKGNVRIVLVSRQFV